MLKSLSLFIFGCFCLFNSFAQNPVLTVNTGGSLCVLRFTLSGKLNGRDTGIIVLSYPDTAGKYRKDTTYLKDGMFQFEGAITGPSFVHLIGSHHDGNYSDMFIEPGYQSITLDENNFADFKLEGSFTQRQSDSLYLMIAAQKGDSNVYIKYVESSLEFLSTKDSILKGWLEAKLADLEGELYSSSTEMQHLIKIGFILQHPNSYVSSTQLYGPINSLSLDIAESIFNSLTDKIKNSRVGQLCLEELNKKRKIRAGVAISDFKTGDINGRTISLSQFKGRYVLLDFWASWCVPCRKAIPELKEVYEKFRSSGLEIVTISRDKNRKEWEEAIKKEKINDWYNLLANEEVNQIFEAIHFIPAQVLIDPDGLIIWSSVNENTKSWRNV